MVGKEVAFASPMSFIVARGLSAPHALTRTYSTMRSSSGKRTDGGRTVSPVCLPTAALHRHPSKSDKSRIARDIPSNLSAPAQITEDVG